MIEQALKHKDEKVNILITYPNYHSMISDLRKNKEALKPANIYWGNITFPNGAYIALTTDDYQRFTEMTFDKVYFHEYGKVAPELESFVLSRLSRNPEVTYAAV